MRFTFYDLKTFFITNVTLLKYKKFVKNSSTLALTFHKRKKKLKPQRFSPLGKSVLFVYFCSDDLSYKKIILLVTQLRIESEDYRGWCNVYWLASVWWIFWRLKSIVMRFLCQEFYSTFLTFFNKPESKMKFQINFYISFS